MGEDAKKSTVQHKPTMTKFNTPIRKITQKCILENCEPDIPAYHGTQPQDFSFQFGVSTIGRLRRTKVKPCR
jgi:hypothetical protein